MAIDINKVRKQYAKNREETINACVDLLGITLSEWTFTEVSAEEKKGLGNDILVLFHSTLTKEGENDILIDEIIDYHRLSYSYSYGWDIPEPEEEETEPEDEDEENLEDI